MKWLLKIIGVALFAWILWKIDRQALLEHISRANLPMLLVAFSLQFIIYAAKTVRWHLFIRSAGIRPTLKDSWELVNIGFFLATITPAKIGEFGKSAYLMAAGMPKAKAIGIVILDRILDVFVIAIIGIVGVGILFGWPLAVLLFAITLLVSPIIFWIVSTTATIKETLKFFGLKTFIPSLHTFALALLATLTGWIAYFTWAVLIARSLGIDIPVHILISAFTITGIVSLLPIAPSGLGTRDIALLTLLSPYGLLAPQTVALSFLMFVSIILSSVVGMTYWIKGHKVTITPPSVQ